MAESKVRIEVKVGDKVDKKIYTVENTPEAEVGKPAIIKNVEKLK